MINISLEESDETNISYISIERAKKENGIQNPNYTEIYNLEAPNYQTTDSQHRFSIDSIDNEKIGSNGHNYHDIVNKEIDILCCNNVYSIKTRTYVNSKKILKMFLPVFVLLILIAILIVLFKIDLLFENQKDSLSNV